MTTIRTDLISANGSGRRNAGARSASPDGLPRASLLARDIPAQWSPRRAATAHPDGTCRQPALRPGKIRLEIGDGARRRARWTQCGEKASSPEAR